MAQNCTVEEVVRAMMTSYDIRPKQSVTSAGDYNAARRVPPPPGFAPTSTPIPGHIFSLPPQGNMSVPPHGMTFTSHPSLAKIPCFSGEIPTPKGEVNFGVWRYEVQCLMRAGETSQVSILSVIRASLRGRARELLVPLGGTASLFDVLAKLDAMFSNVASKEDLLQQFFNSAQQVSESVADYACRIESLLQSVID